MTTLVDVGSASPAQGDMDLLRRFADGRDESAFAEIVRRYAGMVYAASFRVLRNRQWAEDATQETFLRLMRRPQSVTISLGGWLHRAATQLAIDVSRSESARRRRERAHGEEQSEVLDDRKSWREISDSIDAALAHLPEDARDLLVQHFILGRPQKAIADEYRTSTPTICRRVGDAMEQLRAVLKRGGMSLGAIAIAGDFLALNGTQSISLTLQQELGKMHLLAGVRQGWKLVRTREHRGSLWQAKELELAALVVVGAAAVVLAMLLFLKTPRADRPPQHDPHIPTAAQPR